jgi:hypothetical protein
MPLRHALLMKTCASPGRLITKASALFSVLISLAPATHGQGTITFTAGTETAQQGSPVEVPITVTGFSSVADFQFSLTWDPAVLRLDNFTPGSVFFGGAFHFIFGPSGGPMSVVWMGGQVGASLPDGYTLLQLDFTAVGNPGSRSSIDFSDTPTQESVTQRIGLFTTTPATFVPVSGEFDVASVPEPSTLALAACGLAAALLRRGLKLSFLTPPSTSVASPSAPLSPPDT